MPKIARPRSIMKIKVPKFKEETTVVSFRVPISKRAILVDLMSGLVEEWRIANKNTKLSDMNRDSLRKAVNIDDQIMQLEKELFAWENSEKLLNPDSRVSLRTKVLNTEIKLSTIPFINLKNLYIANLKVQIETLKTRLAELKKEL